LKYDWKISRNSSRNKQNLVIKVNGIPSGEAAPNIRWEETISKIESEFLGIKELLPGDTNELGIFAKKIRDLKICQSLKCALDMACISISQKLDKSNFVEKHIKCKTSYSLPIMKPSNYKTFFDTYNLFRFDTIKVKLSTEDIVDTLSEVRKFYSGRLYVDFNEAFDSFEQFYPYIDELNRHSIEVIEQPFHSGDVESNKASMPLLNGFLILDESITDKELPPKLNSYCDGINIKIQKTGGPSRAQEMLDQASKLGLKKMVGCMVESSLGISHSMRLSGVDYYDLDGSLMIDNEPFGFLNEEKGMLNLKTEIL
jgi:glutamate racemase